jgi:uncharacterized protein YuzE
MIRRQMLLISNSALERFHESEEIAPDIIVDFDADGKIVGLEFLRASEQFSAEALTSFGQAD